MEQGSSTKTESTSTQETATDLSGQEFVEQAHDSRVWQRVEIYRENRLWGVAFQKDRPAFLAVVFGFESRVEASKFKIEDITEL